MEINCFADENVAVRPVDFIKNRVAAKNPFLLYMVFFQIYPPSVVPGMESIILFSGPEFFIS